MRKRDFIKYSGLITGALITGALASCKNEQAGKTGRKMKTGSKIRLKYKP